jgi:hypothetical protein
VLSGQLPDLNAYEFPWIDSAMDWHIHSVVLQASAEVMTRPSEELRGGEVDANVQVHKSCDVGVIEPTKDLKGPREGFAICEEYPLVPCFEGEEDNRAETMDLPIAQDSLAPTSGKGHLSLGVFDCL